MNTPADKSLNELTRRGYSDEEVSNIYELGRLFLENGNIKRAEPIMLGLTEVVPDFAPAWLGLAYVHIQNRDYDAAIFSARQALRIDPDMIEAMLYLVACLLTSGDINSAGTYLGEIGERIDSGIVDSPNAVRLYRSQLARYQAR